MWYFTRRPDCETSETTDIMNIFDRAAAAARTGGSVVSKMVRVVGLFRYSAHPLMIVDVSFPVPHGFQKKYFCGIIISNFPFSVVPRYLYQYRGNGSKVSTNGTGAFQPRWRWS